MDESSPDLRAESINNDNEWIPKRAGRLQLACTPCKLAKQKCDRQLPICKQCERRGRASICRYTERGLRSNLVLWTRDSRESNEDKIQRLEAFIRELQGQIKTNTKNMQSRDSLHEKRTDREVALDSPDRSIVTSTSSLKLLPSNGHQWIASCHWQSVLCEIVEPGPQSVGIINSEHLDCFSETNTTDANSSITSIPWIHAPQHDVETLIAQLPARDSLDTYISTWFNLPEYHKIIVHAPTFQQQYSEFWNDPSTIQSGWHALMFAITSIGAEVLGQIQSNSEIQAQAECLRKLTAYSLGTLMVTVPSDYTIEAMIIHALGLLFKTHNVNMYVWQILGWIVRSCYQRGYHRKPNHNSGVSTFEAEMRSRTWLLVQFLESHASSSVGMPSSLVPNISDAPLPQNVEDHDFDRSTVVIQPRPETNYTPTLTAIYSWKINQSLCQIINASQQLQMISDQQLASLNRDLDQTRSQLPSLLQRKALHECIIEPKGQIAGRIKIEILYLRAKCHFFYAFLRRSSTSVQEDLRSQCLLSAMNMVILIIEVLSGLKPGGWLSDMKILLVRHIHDFKFAAVLLCGELWAAKSAESVMPLRDCYIGPYSLLEVKQRLRDACELWEQIEWRSSASSIILEMLIRLLNDLDQHQHSENVSPGLEELYAQTIPEAAATAESPRAPSRVDRNPFQEHPTTSNARTEQYDFWDFPWVMSSDFQADLS